MVELCLEYGAIIRQPKVSNDRYYSWLTLSVSLSQTDLGHSPKIT